MAAENYHLKWDSHLSYLNTSIATLYKNEKFADVVLYSSYNSSSSINSDIPTVGISAHKFILSSCSQFFATMFETAPISSPNGVLYIVLPPDLSHRAIQILVQYMYSGEATVSNDILNEVLRGGEILKIRGLCRTSASGGNNSSTAGQPSSSLSSTHHHAHGVHSGHLHQRDNNALYIPNGSRSTLPPPPPISNQLTGDMYGNGSKSTSSNTRYSLEHHHSNPHQHQHHQQFRGLGASVMPKDSPVIVKSPKIAAHTGLLSVASSSSKLHTSSAGVGGISVNKEVAIDPEDKCCYAPSQVESLPATTTVAAGPAPMSICTEVGCSSCPLAAPSTESESALRRRDYNERIPDDHALCERDDVGLVYERRLRRESACERAHDYFTHEASHFEHVVKPYVGEPAPSRLPTPPHPHSFLTIKQEPTDWSSNPPTATVNNNNINANELNNEAALSPKQPLDFKISAVKLETNRSTPQDDHEPEEHTLRDYNNFKLLVCEICQKSFEDTKTLVRHLGTHAAEPADRNHTTNICSSGSSMTGNGGSASTSSNSLALRALKTYVPKKRRRVSQQENNMDHVTLLCDLCSTSFETPAEWVRHMNSQHTEIELAMFNSKKDGEQKSNSSNTSTASGSQLQQQAAAAAAAAVAAHKKYANANRQSLLLHKRSASNNSSSSNGAVAPAASLNASPGLATATSSHA